MSSGSWSHVHRPQPCPGLTAHPCPGTRKEYPLALHRFSPRGLSLCRGPNGQSVQPQPQTTKGLQGRPLHWRSPLGQSVGKRGHLCLPKDVFLCPLAPLPTTST